MRTTDNYLTMITGPDMLKRADFANSLLRLFFQAATRKEFLTGATKLVHKWCGCECAGIRALDASGNIPYAAHTGFSPWFTHSESCLRLGRDQCACTRVIEGKPEPQDSPAMTSLGSFCSNNTVQFVNNLTEPQKTRFRGVCIRTGYKSVAVVPIRYGETVRGAIHLADRRENAFPPDVLRYVETMAPLIGEGIYRFHIEEQLGRNHDVQAAVATLLRLSLEDLPLGIFFTRSLEAIHTARKAISSRKSCLFVADDSPGPLILKADHGMKGPREDCSRINPGDCLCGQAALARKIQFADNLNGKALPCDDGKPRNHYCVPVTLGKTALGVLNVTLAAGRGHDPVEEEFLTTAAGTLAGIIARKQSHDRLRDLSRKLLQAQEDERRNIGRELHDEIGQSMTVLILALDAAQRSKAEELPAALSESMAVAREVLSQYVTFPTACRRSCWTSAACYRPLPATSAGSARRQASTG